MKVTWITSSRIHFTKDGYSTICGHIFGGENKTVKGELEIDKQKKHCKICFTKHTDFKSNWIKE